MVHFINAASFLRLDLRIAGFTDARIGACKSETNVERFRTWYGVSPEACAEIFQDLQMTMNLVARIENAKALDMLMTLNWLMNYRKEAELAGTFKMNEKTARNILWRYTNAFAAMKADVITLDVLANREETMVFSVDPVLKSFR